MGSCQRPDADLRGAGRVAPAPRLPAPFPPPERAGGAAVVAFFFAPALPGRSVAAGLPALAVFFPGLPEWPAGASRRLSGIQGGSLPVLPCFLGALLMPAWYTPASCGPPERPAELVKKCTGRLTGRGPLTRVRGSPGPAGRHLPRWRNW